MKSDKGQFDEVLRRMIETPPKKTSEIEAPKKCSEASEVSTSNGRGLNPHKRRTVSTNAPSSFRRLNL